MSTKSHKQRCGVSRKSTMGNNSHKQGYGNACKRTLRSNSVRAGREQLRDAGRLQALLGQTESSAQTGTAGTNDDRIEGVVDDGVLRTQWCVRVR